MICKDFNELVDSYLCDELAVETNHQVIAHLEVCSGCRRELVARRELRGKIKSAVIGSSEFQIDPSFAANLRGQLLAGSKPNRIVRNWKFLAPAFATILLMAGFLGFAAYQRALTEDSTFRTFLAAASREAVGDHKYCALGKLEFWENSNERLTAEQTEFIETLAGDGTEILNVHDCIFQGKTYRHYILRRNGNIVSVASVASDLPAEANPRKDKSIMSERDEGYQVASFQSGTNLVFVISDLSESENLAMARKLSDSLKS